jgi:Phytanoyl-CoA dioxygenase (PhyH)
VLSLRHPTRSIAPRTGVLSGWPPSEVRRAAGVVNERGYFVFPQRLPSDMCDRLLEFALTQPGLMCPPDDPEGPWIPAVYDPARPLSPYYQFRRSDLINHPDVQALMAEPALVELSQAYLRAEPVADSVRMWWYTASAELRGAQQYHCDMGRIKWVRYFIYLTDVEPGNGPHCFVVGSHRRGAIPRRFFSRGFAQVPDEEVSRHYKPEDIVEVLGPRGTIIAEDTRGLHKGQQLRSGHRLILQIQFSNSLFGHQYPTTRFDALKNPGLIELVAQYPRMYSAFLPPVRSR